MNNYVTIFSNGMAHFSRHLGEVTEPRRISLPVKTKSLDAFLGTLGVFGNVALAEAPSFASQEDQNRILRLDPANLNRDLAKRLAGAQVSIHRKDGSHINGTLAGRQDYTELAHEVTVDRYSVVVYSEDGSFQSVPDTDLSLLTFTQAEVQQVIKKALSASYNSINPDSTLVEFTLAPLPDQEDRNAIYEFTVPFAAWQPVYQFRFKDGKLEIECSAKVDNPTDEDLEDTIFTVATGDPTTFETDLAEVRIPRRQRINIVADEATGPEQMSNAMEQFDESIQQHANASGGTESLDMGGGRQAKGAVAQGARTRGTPILSYAHTAAAPPPRVTHEQATLADVGDFAIFTSDKPRNLGRKRSGLIPLFQRAAEGEAVLTYQDTQKDKNRPMRAVRFKNTTPYTLGRGGVTVYHDDTYQGQNILESTKPGKECLIPHARENGVQVFTNPPGSGYGSQTRRTRLEIAKGVVQWDTLHSTDTVYRFSNDKEEPFKVEVEHTRRFQGNDSTANFRGNSGPVATLENGYRIPAVLPARKDGKPGLLEIRVTEIHTQHQTTVLDGNNGVFWLKANLIDTTNPTNPALSKNKKLVGVLEAHAKVAEVQERLRTAEQKSQVLQREQSRKLELVRATPSGSQADTWRKELATNEDEVQRIEKHLVPGIEQELKEAQEALAASLKGLSLTWSENQAEER